MKRFLTAVIACSFALALLAANPAWAAFSKSHIIDDFVFDNSQTMTKDQINAFLNSFPNSCISQNKGFKAPDPTGYSPSGGFTYGGDVSAGRVIIDAANAYHLNPRVILATLQKEQSLVSGGDGSICPHPTTTSKLPYVGAMGYGCPDGGTTHKYSGFELYSINGNKITSVSGTCVSASSSAGFSRQVIHAAWLLKFGEQRAKGNVDWAEIHDSWDNSDDPATCYYGYMTEGDFARGGEGSGCTRVVHFDGDYTIDGTAVHMDNGATAALYWYTPHLHGNQSFVNIYESWFGSTRATPIKTKVIDGASDEDGHTARVEFWLATLPTASVTIPLTVSDTSEASLGGTNSLTIAPANWNKPANNIVTISGVDDANADGDISYQLRTGDPTSSDDAYGSLVGSDVKNPTLVNTDNEPDVPLAGDWNHSGKTHIGLKRGNEYRLNYGNDDRADTSFHYGSWSDTAIAGDWDGDGKAEIGLKIGNQYRLNYGNDSHSEVTFTYGRDSDVPIVGDWDGDGKDEVGLKRGNEYFLNYGNDSHSEVHFTWGQASDVAFAGNWDGNRDGKYHKGKDHIGLKRGDEYLLNNGNDGKANIKFHYGLAGDSPLAGDWDGDHKSEVGYHRGNHYYLNFNNDGDSDVRFTFGR